MEKVLFPIFVALGDSAITSMLIEQCQREDETMGRGLATRPRG